MSQNGNGSAPELDLRTYQIKTVEGTFEIDVPASWKVTFSHVNPAAAASPERRKGWALRIFEAKDRQRACFTGVLGFMDKSIGVRQVEDQDILVAATDDGADGIF